MEGAVAVPGPAGALSRPDRGPCPSDHQDLRASGSADPGDRAYIGAGTWVTTPARRPAGSELSLTQQTVNRALLKARVPVEGGIARLKSWRIFRRARCSPNRMTSIAAAVLALERQR
ncbi:hypothetical protein GCM10022295_26780 [Streptomyces osmaniensis]|uniref:DDE Tnp4 domain-containing protein n=1 Tax=Streptomyces osmaniensis TaxID=593134 RepID=A0ABP6W2Q2_9ACTN